MTLSSSLLHSEPLLWLFSILLRAVFLVALENSDPLVNPDLKDLKPLEFGSRWMSNTLSSSDSDSD